MLQVELTELSSTALGKVHHLTYDRNGSKSRHVSNGVLTGYKNPANVGRPLIQRSPVVALF
jgi:hypothetical protein